LKLACLPADDVVEKARRTIVRSFFGYSSDSVFNHSGEVTFSVDRSGVAGTPVEKVWQNYTDALLAIIDRLRGVCIDNRDAFDLFDAWDSERVVWYVDPPYLRGVRKLGGYRHEFTDDQHERLGGVVNRLKGCVLLSGYPSELYDKMFSHWQRFEKEASVPQNYGTDPLRVEVLWVKPAGKIF
jgi:DNA adenine methylase